MGKSKTMPGDDAEQSKRFIEAAKKVEADETKEGADRAFRKAVKPKKTKTDRPSGQRRST